MKTLLATLPAVQKVGWVSLLFLWFVPLFLTQAPARAQTSPFVVWVYDKGVRDTQFGYYDGVISQAIGPVSPDLDIEGLSCIAATIYASSGGDGRAPSRLFALTLDLANATTQLTEVAPLRTPAGESLYEMTALTTWANQTLWGFAAEGSIKGLFQIDPATGVATLAVSSTLDVAAIAWLDDTLWLAAGDQLYTWQPGGAITPAFAVDGIDEIEALDAINGSLYLGGDDQTTVMAVDPATGQPSSAPTFPVPDDIEGFTFCPGYPPVATPTASPTTTATPSPTPSATPSAIAATPTATPSATSSVTPPTAATATPTPTATASSTSVEGTNMTPTPTATGTPTPTTPPPAIVTPDESAPTSLEVAAFWSTRHADQIELTWETSVEVETIGFRLWRSTGPTRDQAVLLGPALIPAQGNRSRGAIYGYPDTTVQTGVDYTYWLETVRADGATGETLILTLRFAQPLYLPYVSR